MTDTEHDYNASVVETRYVHEALMILRVVPDRPMPQFLPGQYTTLGLRTTEPRIDGIICTQMNPPHLIRRAYSISHPLIDDSGKLLTQGGCGFLEFYVALVRRPDDTPPPLTPRLFSLKAGHRIFVDPRAHGHYTLDSVNRSDNVIFAATGTGEAPHNAMVAELLGRSHQGQIASIVSVRYRLDLGYLEAHRKLERCYANYRYIPLTTREPENSDADRPDFIGKLYLQDLFSSDTLSDRLGWQPSPATTHVFLCGSPVMIGVPVRGDNGDFFPGPTGMIEVLTQLGFQPDRPRVAGNIHFEKYW